MATMVETRALRLEQGEALCQGTIALDSSYPTGGEVFDAPGDLGYSDWWVTSETAGYLLVWDKANQKVKALQQSAATGAFTEVPNTTDLSAVSIRYCALRQF